jgi:hypothetical protein
VIVDYEKPHCYLHEWHRASEFHFKSLAELADAVLKVKNHLILKVDLNCTTQNIYIVLEGGLLETSPLDGEPCHITSFN